MTAQETTISRWLFTWITILGLVVVVVVGFLIGIVNALESIDGNLGQASGPGKKIGPNAVPLARQLQGRNGNPPHHPPRQDADPGGRQTGRGCRGRGGQGGAGAGRAADRAQAVRQVQLALELLKRCLRL